MEHESNALYIGREHFERRLWEYAVQLSFDRKALGVSSDELTRLNGRYAYIQGVFRASEQEHSIPGNGTIEDIGLYYMQARWYDPTAGRFASIDPLVPSRADPQSLNPYGYVRNNPLNRVDPTGAEDTCLMLDCVMESWAQTLKADVELSIAMSLYREVQRFEQEGYELAAMFPADDFLSTDFGLDRLGASPFAYTPLDLELPQLEPSAPTPSAASPGDPRPLSSIEQQYLEYITGESFEGVQVDEGSLGESFASGMVRSDREINMGNGFSRLGLRERLARLVHEAAHILQRREGTLSNFRGFFSHLRARLTGKNLYGIPAGFKGDFSQLNFEQQAVVLENAARIDLGLPIQNYGGGLTNADYRLLYADFLTGR